MKSDIKADFVVLTALDEETEALKRRLENVTWIKGTRYSRGTISHHKGEEKYIVVYAQCDETGNYAAGPLTMDAIKEFHPEYVILVGIAAGFPERDVALGDVLVPKWVVPYEKAKIKPDSVERRSLPLRVKAVRLQHIAKQIADHERESWYTEIQGFRPNNAQRAFPLILCKGLLGSGEKIVGDQLAQERKYLIENFPDALGLEMEAAGLAYACYERETSFLVVKGVQDDATVGKDAMGQKDVWRLYAADAAAVLTAKIISYVQVEQVRPATVTMSVSSIETYENRLWRVLEEYERGQPAPSFAFTVSQAETYRELRAGNFLSRNQPAESILPSENRRAIVLHGGGGAGKTRILRNISRELLEEGRLPILVELRRLSARPLVDKSVQSDVQDILKECGNPRFRPDLLGNLAQGERDFIVILDGLNEVPRPARENILRYFRNMLGESPHGYLIIADRYGTSEYPEDFVHASVDPLDENFARQVFDSRFAPEMTFEQLSPSIKPILRIPFFLDLIIRKMMEIGRMDSRSAMMEAFFLKQLRLAGPDLDSIAQATLELSEEYQAQLFESSRFKEKAGNKLYDLLCEASIIGLEGATFAHHLWRDYLCARHLAKHPDKWNEKTFDAVTFTSESLEPLTLVVEQLDNIDKADDFIRKVYDWNFYGAMDCLREPGELSRPFPSMSIRIAILSAITEKKFDRVRRTCMRAHSRLREHRYDVALPFAQVDTFEKLIEHVKNLRLKTEKPWFNEWKILFVGGIDPVGLLMREDSIIGWTAANVARRSRLNKQSQKRVRELYISSDSNEETNSIRWRLVHVLGAYPSKENTSLLVEALNDDKYHWVKYGAARALIEIASTCGQKLKRQVLTELEDSIKQIWQRDIRIGRLIAKEIRQTVFISSTKPKWKESVNLLLQHLRDLEQDASELADWDRIIVEFNQAELE